MTSLFFFQIWLTPHQEGLLKRKWVVYLVFRKFHNFSTYRQKLKSFTGSELQGPNIYKCLCWFSIMFTRPKFFNYSNIRKQEQVVEFIWTKYQNHPMCPKLLSVRKGSDQRCDMLAWSRHKKMMTNSWPDPTIYYWKYYQNSGLLGRIMGSCFILLEPNFLIW